ncbi:MAG: endonuclease III [Anaerolineales bacterium]|nr:endonuclease III [Anaerolineales bacterium]
MPALRGRAQRIYRKLRDTYGEPVWERKPSPVDELISTILSQNTNDSNREKAFSALRRKYPRWEDVLNAPAKEIVAAIRPAGLGPQKGPRIQKALAAIRERGGRIGMDFLRGFPAEEVRSWLTSLPGVGPKTAAIVMLFALDIPAFPVDTHVQRVTGRLGLRPPRMSADKAHEHLAGLFDPEQYATAHLNLIRLGREVCHARAPECGRCVFRRMCPFHRSHPSRAS